MLTATSTAVGLSATAQAIPHSRIRELAEIAMRMDGVLKLYFGESNVPTPDFIKKAADNAMWGGQTLYTSNAGTMELREALAAYYQRMHQVKLDTHREIMVTHSGVQALNLGIRCLLDPGDEAIVLTPAWPNGSAIIEMVNAKCRQVAQVLRHGRYVIDFEALEATVTPRTRMLLLTSPSNPLGWVATVEEQQQVLDFCRRHGLWLMADEVYERLTYDVSYAPSILRLATRDDAVIVVQSFSKSYCMTGWRLGWMVGRADFIARATQLNEFGVSCSTHFIQHAGAMALGEGEDFLREMLGYLRGNRDFCLNALQSMPGLTIPQPEGAFYLFPRVDGLTDSFEFCKRLLLETKVGLAPGVAFGAGGEGSIRLCYAADRGILEPAMERLGQFLRSR